MPVYLNYTYCEGFKVIRDLILQPTFRQEFWSWCGYHRESATRSIPVYHQRLDAFVFIVNNSFEQGWTFSLQPHRSLLDMLLFAF
jgi:hypothetical protein